MMSDESTVIIPVADLFKNASYQIPLYQRDYAWGIDEIETLFRDIDDYYQKHPSSEKSVDYYLGSLVLYRSQTPKNAVTFEVVDGQQRLTTLFFALRQLLKKYPHNESLNTLAASFGSQQGCPLVFEGQTDCKWHLDFEESHDCNNSLRVAIETIRELLAHYITEDNEDEYIKYLLERVKIVRTELPPGTDLNHYFEIMNSRGEQLEKHEILKARLLNLLSEARDRTVFGNIWDACSDMSRPLQYVAQNSADLENAFESEHWIKTPSSNHSASDYWDHSTDEITLSDILSANSGDDATDREDDDYAPLYQSIIDFPNFLLHVLSIYLSSNEADHNDVDVSLDDKTLLESFEKITSESSVEKAKSFAITLLKLRYLFDRYVVKRTNDSADSGTNWVLHSVIHSNEKTNEGLFTSNDTFRATSDYGDPPPHDLHARIVMIQSMLQVSEPNQSHKRFLWSILRFLDKQSLDLKIDPNAFFDELNNIANRRYKDVINATDTSSIKLDPQIINNGTGTPRFIFNYLDWKLWLFINESVEAGDQDRSDKLRVFLGVQNLSNNLFDELKTDIQGFRFRYRSSIEHFYPQNPDTTEGHESLPREVVDNFGNLCLMTSSSNSKRSNLMPSAKVAHYSSADQSIKFMIMAALTKHNTWNEAEIKTHGKAMLSVLSATPTPLS